eukprot:5935273-Amphidinium_carterae.1
MHCRQAGRQGGRHLLRYLRNSQGHVTDVLRFAPINEFKVKSETLRCMRQTGLPVRRAGSQPLESGFGCMDAQ